MAASCKIHEQLSLVTDISFTYVDLGIFVEQPDSQIIGHYDLAVTYRSIYYLIL